MSAHNLRGRIIVKGELEIDPNRGVIYFHSKEGYTALRICRLPIPVPEPSMTTMLDITHMKAASWRSLVIEERADA